MSVQHRTLVAGRWFELTLMEQMANVGSEVERAIRRRQEGDTVQYQRAVERALELLELTIDDAKNRKRLREICRVREVLADYFHGKNQYGYTDKAWHDYFFAFAYAAQTQPRCQSRRRGPAGRRQ